MIGIAPAAAALVVHLRAHLVGRVEELGAVRREQGLVGRHDVGSRAERLEEIRACRLDAADELDDDVRAQDERLGVGREELVRKVRVARGIEIAHGDAGELETGPRPVGELGAVFEEEGGDLRTHGTCPEEGDPQAAVVDHALRSFCCALSSAGATVTPRSRARRSSMLSPRTMTRAVPARTATTGGRGTTLYELASEKQYAPVAGTARRSPGRMSPGRYSASTTMSPDSQCLPTTRTRAGGAALAREARRALYCAP